MLQYIEILQHLQVPLLKKARAHLCLQFASDNLDLEKVCEKTNIELFGREMLSSTKRTPSSTDKHRGGNRRGHVPWNCEYCQSTKGVAKEEVIKWCSQAPDLNLTENGWRELKHQAA